jgi:carnitine O-acetyltransferase
MSFEQVARNSLGVLTTENRKTWSHYRHDLANSKHNGPCLEIVDNALFIVCLDDAAPDNIAELCANFLCGTYSLKSGVQVGTCTNRWYDKVSILLSPARHNLTSLYPVATHCLCRRFRRHQLRAYGC